MDRLKFRTITHIPNEGFDFFRDVMCRPKIEAEKDFDNKLLELYKAKNDKLLNK